MKRKKEIVLAIFMLIIFIHISKPILAIRGRSPSVCRVPVVNGICCEQYLSCMQFDWGACIGGIPIIGNLCHEECGASPECDGLEPGEADDKTTCCSGCYFTDVTGDGKVRVDDVLAVSQAFGSNEGDERYDPNLDVNNDGKIRVDDTLAVALKFGADCFQTIGSQTAMAEEITETVIEEPITTTIQKGISSGRRISLDLTIDNILITITVTVIIVIIIYGGFKFFTGRS